MLKHKLKHDAAVLWIIYFSIQFVLLTVDTTRNGHLHIYTYEV